MPDHDPLAELARYPLLDALVDRRSRRFGAGMAMEEGPLAHRSERPSLPLTEAEQAVLAFAACGITGPALADLEVQPGGGGARAGAWRHPDRVAGAAKPPSPAAVDAAIAYCEYVHRRYGRFPAYPPPFRTLLGFQAGHVDPDFYDRHYRPEALSTTQRRHMERWHRGE